MSHYTRSNTLQCSFSKYPLSTAPKKILVDIRCAMISPANLEFMLPSGQVCSTMAQAAKRASTGLNNASGPSRRLELGDDEDHHNHHPPVQTRTGPLHRDGLGVVVAWSSVVNDESLGSWAQVTKMNSSPRYRPIQCRKVETGLRDGAINGHWTISHGFTCVSLLVQRVCGVWKSTPKVVRLIGSTDYP